MSQPVRRSSCIIGIDMGAKCTGVFSSVFDEGELPNSSNCRAMTLVMPQDSDKDLKYSQTARTMVRHRLRGKKRYSMVRRLAFLIVEDQLKRSGCVLADEELRRSLEALNGLLRRRGYSRPNAEDEDLTPLEAVRADVFAAHPVLGHYFSPARPLLDQWEEHTADVDNAAEFLADDALPTPDDFADFAESEGLIDKDDKKAYKTALKKLLDNASSLANLRRLGHKPRAEYFKAVREDLARDSRLEKIVEVFGGVDRFARLIGHLSNLQLRAERWYFNAPELMKSPGWEPDRFRKTLVRAFKFWHPDKDRNKAHLELIARIEASKDVIDTLCTLDPELTIPPYEDQNNRRPPVDQTLFLSPAKLSSRYSDLWRAWAIQLAAADPSLRPSADILNRATDRKSRVAVDGRPQQPLLAYEFSYVLQRAFDRSKALDPYALRALAAGSTSNRLTSARAALETCLGRHHVETFLDCARRYYDEVEDAKVGLWFDNPEGLLERSDLHPPMKRKILPLLVANILQCEEKDGLEFLADVWRRKIKGRETPASRCARIETSRKNLGGGFNIAYRTAIFKEEKKLKLTTEEKKLLKLRDLVEETADFIAGALGLDEAKKSRFANPYSLAQLYTLIETEVSGFSATTLAAHLENAWRMTSVSLKNGDKVVTSAQCSRLPAETARPFDGFIRRIVDRQAWEIAKRTADDIRRQAAFDHGLVDVSLFVEENRFEFSASVADLKKNAQARKKANDMMQKADGRWADKTERIKAASRGLCPYCGGPLTAGGEIDHILPRSLFRDARGVVFNAEPNLIYVMAQCNQRKKDSRYHLSDLNAKYLNVLFGSSNTADAAAEIEQVVSRLQSQNRLKFFDLLNEHEQDCVRHALFLDDGSEARRAVLDLLETQRKARVNGTQLWMIKSLAAKIRIELSDWCRKTGNRLNFHAAATDVSSAKLLRSQLAAHDAELAKPDVQPVSSHTIDALCAFVVGAAEEGGAAERAFYDDIESVHGLRPTSCEVVRLQPKGLEEKTNFDGVAIFKEGIYAEEFLPIFTLRGKIYVGYETRSTAQSAIEVGGKKPAELLELLCPFFGKPVGDPAAHNIYRIQRKPAFEFLAKAALQPLTELEKRQAAVLDELRFFTTRKNLSKFLLTPNGKALKKRDEVLAAKLFRVAVALSGEKAFKLKGELTLPLR